MNDIKIKKLLHENKFLIAEVSIDTSSMAALVKEAKLNPIKKAQWAMIERELTKRAKELAVKRDELVAKLTDDIVRNAEKNGKPIASSAVKDLQKTKIPLYKEYTNLDKLVREAEADARFASRMYSIMESRGRAIDYLLKIEEKLSLKEKIAFSDSEVMQNRHKIMKGKLMKIYKKYGGLKNE